MSKSANLQVLRTTKKSRSEPSERLLFKLMGLPSATLAWYKQPPAMRVCIKNYTKNHQSYYNKNVQVYCKKEK